MSATIYINPRIAWRRRGGTFFVTMALSCLVPIHAFLPMVANREVGTRGISIARSKAFGKKAGIIPETTALAGHKNHFDMNELRHFIQESTNPYTDDMLMGLANLLPAAARSSIQGGSKNGAPQSSHMSSLTGLENSDSGMGLPDDVYVVMFHVGTEQQSAHAIEYPKGSGRNIVLAFESSTSARHFARRLEEQDFANPTPMKFALPAFDSICDALGIYMRIVPKHVANVMPPTSNVENFGKHNPNLRNDQTFLTYVFDMSADEMQHEGLIYSKRECANRQSRLELSTAVDDASTSNLHDSSPTYDDFVWE